MAPPRKTNPTLRILKAHALVNDPTEVRDLNEAQEATRLVAALEAAIHEADTSGRRQRLARNETNMAAYLGRQDWAGKIEGQSREFLPKTGIAADKLAAKVRQAVIGGDWLKLRWRERSQELGTIDPETILPADAATAWLKFELENMACDPSHFGVLLSDSVKAASLEASVALKVSDGWVKPAAGPRGKKDAKPTFRLKVELIPFAELLRDPTGADTYLMHRYNLDLYKARERAEQGDWDSDAVDELRPQELAPPDKKRDQDRAEDGADHKKQAGRRRVTIVECWGKLLDQETGEVLHDGLLVVGNPSSQNLILYQGENPFWHGKRPFGFLELRRVPGSTKHRAMLDDCAQLNFALNELFNLYVDGNISSVWGIRQLRAEYLDDPRQADDGIPQGECLIVNSSLPPGELVMQRVDSGAPTRDVLSGIEALQYQIADASFSGDMNVAGSNRDTKATEIVARSQQEQGFAGDLIWGILAAAIEPVLEMCFTLMVQRISDMSTGELMDALGPQTTIRLGQMSKHAEGQGLLFDALCGPHDVAIEGLREMSEQGRLFSRAANLIQLSPGMQVAVPVLQAAGIDPTAFFKHMIRLAGLDPSKYKPEANQQQMPGPPQEGEEGQGEPGGMQMQGAAGQVMPGLPQPGSEHPAGGQHPLRQLAAANQRELASR